MAQILRSVLMVCSTKVNIRVLLYIINTHIQKNKPANGEEKDGTRSMLTGSKLNILESKNTVFFWSPDQSIDFSVGLPCCIFFINTTAFIFPPYILLNKELQVIISCYIQ